MLRRLRGSSANSLRLAKLLDLARERGVFGRHVPFDVGEPAIDVSQPRPDIARGTRWRRTHTLPEPTLLRIGEIKLAWLRWGDHGGDEIEGQDPAAAHKDGRQKADPDQIHVEARVIRDTGTHAEQLAVTFVAIESGAARRLLREILPFRGKGGVGVTGVQP